MRRLILACLCLALAFPTFAQGTKRKKQKKQDKSSLNLIKNGDFEQPGSSKQPKNWSKLDGLTGKIQKNGGNPGACLLLDTSVLQIDKKLIQQSEEEFKKKGRGKGGQYDTVGAHEGAWAYAEPVDILPDDEWFILSADVASTERSSELFYPMVLIRGFVKITGDQVGKDTTWFHDYFDEGIGYSEMFGSNDKMRPSKEGDYLMVYRHTLSCRVVTPNEFRRFQLGFKLPKMKRFRPERLLIKPYAFWPNGQYWFDNITLKRATKEEADEVNRNRPTIKEVQ